jgi:hypothetical protein
MANTHEISGPPEHPVNGAKVPANPLAKEILTQTRQKSTDRDATRYLSAATQISITYAERVVARVMNEPFRALAPTYGVDVAVVTRWALKALRTRALRDNILAAICLLVIPVLALPFFWLPGLFLFPVVFIAAWQVVSWEHWQRFFTNVTQRMLRDRFDPSEAPVPHRESDRTRLTEVTRRRDGNLVVFSGHSAFIGSGTKQGYQRILLDVSRGKETDDGTPREPDDFTSEDLHKAIVRAFDHKTGLGRSLANIRVYERLFVNGLHIQEYDGLLLDPLRPPPASVDEEVLVAATLHPTPEARTYVCVEMPGWQGQLVVTLFIRAVHTGESLYIDWTFQVLPPLKDRFLIIDQFYERSRSRQFRISLWLGLRTTIPELLKSPYRVLRTWRRPHIARRHQSQQSRAIERGFVFDYGAQRSIREDACGTQRRHYFLARDEKMYMLLAQQTLTRAIELFLKEHNVDLGQFSEQVKIIFDNSIKVGDISNSTGVTIGDNSSTKVNGSSEGAK